MRLRTRVRLQQQPVHPAIAPLALALDMPFQIALFLEAQTFQQPLGAPVADMGAGAQALEADRGGVGQNGADSFDPVALAPSLARNHEPQFGPVMALVDVDQLAKTR